MSFGNRIAQLRASLGWTQLDLAERCELQSTAIAHYEAGRREPTLTNIVKICRGFGVEPNVLIKMEDYK